MFKKSDNIFGWSQLGTWKRWSIWQEQGTSVEPGGFGPPWHVEVSLLVHWRVGFTVVWVVMQISYEYSLKFPQINVTSLIVFFWTFYTLRDQMFYCWKETYAKLPLCNAKAGSWGRLTALTVHRTPQPHLHSQLVARSTQLFTDLIMCGSRLDCTSERI